MKHLLFFLALFPSIIGFSQDTLKVAVYNKAPFGMQEDGEFDGLMVEIWEDIAKELNLAYDYQLVDMKSLLSGVNSGKYDIGLGAISVTPEREELVDFTHAVNPSGTTIGVSKAKSKIGFFRKWAPILLTLLELLAVLFLMLLLAATLVWLVERKHVKDSDDNEKRIRNITDGLWWSAVTMTTVGYGDKVPMSHFGKLIGIIWIFTSIIFFSLFTANASAKLNATHQYHSRIRTVEDLHRAKVVAVKNSSGEAYLKREKVNYDGVSTLNEAFDQVLTGDADAVVYNAPVLKYYNRTQLNQKLVINDDYLLNNNMAIALQPNSKYEEAINIILLEKISEAKWQAAVYKYIGE